MWPSPPSGGEPGRTGPTWSSAPTRFCEVAYWQWPPGASHQRHGVPDVVDIGFTWLAGPAQRTHVNTEAKLLMMTHAFEVWECPPGGAADRRAQQAIVGRH